MDLEQGALTLADRGVRVIRDRRLWPSVPIPPEWARVVRLQDLSEDITICSWNGCADTECTLRGEAPPMVCIGVLLEGALDMTPDDGPALRLGPGTTLLHAAAHRVTGQDVLRAEQTLRLVDVRYAPEIFLPVVADRAVSVVRDALVPRVSAEQDSSVLCHTPTSPAARRIATEMLACEGFDGPVRVLYLRAKALELLAVVLRDTTPASHDPLPARDRKRVVMACRLLEESYGDPWTTERLARRVGLSEKKLQAGFRRIVGASVHAHLRTVRLAAAEAMLGRGISVTETAYAVGFSSLSHFSKAFKDHTGASPRDWTKRCAGP